jgi:hypothetical protein
MDDIHMNPTGVPENAQSMAGLDGAVATRDGSGMPFTGGLTFH